MTGTNATPNSEPSADRALADAIDRDRDPEAWLGETRQLDIFEPKLRITAQKLTQSRQTLHERAAAIQEFVRRMPFAAAVDGCTVRASEVLRRGSGDCHSKGVLFTALCRAAGLPARLLFVEVKPHFLTGILEARPAVMPHAVGQVLLPEGWRSTDGYVVDPVLFAHAKHLMEESGEDCGWGIVREARGAWDGRQDCLQQFRASDVVDIHGACHEPSEFHTRQPSSVRGWTAWWKYAIGAHLVNRRVAEVRQANFPLPMSASAA